MLEVICFFKHPSPSYIIVSSRQIGPAVICDSIQNLYSGEGGEGRKRGGRSIPELAVTPRTERINRRPDFFFTSSVKQWFITTKSYAPLFTPVGGPRICATLSCDRCLNKILLFKSAVKNSFEVVKNVQLSGLLKLQTDSVKQANFSLESKSFNL